LFLLTLTDIDEMIIPDGCHIAAIIIWIVAEPFLFKGWMDVISHVAAGIVFGGGLLVISLIMDRILGRDSLGGGDIKLFGVVGLYLGFIGTMFVMVFACLGGLLFNVISRMKKKENEEEKVFPFGPWIAIAAAFMLLYGEPLINWYMGLLS
jgi:leader peptidase (prepilin peptidase)/N-methyltransferase